MQNWAKTFKDGKFARFADNPEVLQIFYVKHNMPTRVKDMIPDMEAKLTVIVAKMYLLKPLRLCSECWKGKCDCGKEDYEEYERYSYLVVDDAGDKVYLSIPPWANLDVLEDDETYVVEGKVREYKGKISLDVKSIEKSGGAGIETSTKDTKAPDDIENAKDVIKDAMVLFDGKVPEEKFQQLTKSLSASEITTALKEMGIVCKEGIYLEVETD